MHRSITFNDSRDEPKGWATPTNIAVSYTHLDVYKRQPEFINRIDEIVVFNALDQKAIREIARIQIRKLAKRMEQQNIGLAVTEAALDEIGKVGFDPLFGARPLRRAVQDYLENQIAVDILKGKYAPGDTVFVDYVDGNFIFEDRKDNR